MAPVRAGLRLRLASRLHSGVLAFGLLLGPVAVHAKDSPPPGRRSFEDKDLRSKFKEHVCEALAKTEGLSEKERIKALERVLDLDLGQVGIDPALLAPGRIRLSAKDTWPLDGEFYPPPWTAIISNKLLKPGPLTPKVTAALLEILLHEVLHPEFLWLLTCWLVDTRQDTSENLRRLQVPERLIWLARYGARLALDKKQARKAAALWTRYSVPALVKQVSDFEKLRQALQMAGKARKAAMEAKERAEQRQALRAERRRLAAALATAKTSFDKLQRRFAHALKDRNRLPDEARIKKVLTGLGGCGP